jgi:hypothetical protein
VKRRLASMSLVVALALVPAGVALGHVKYFPTTLHAEYRDGTFSGELVSVNEKCNASRKIVITVAGAAGDEVIGRGTSDSQGFFEFPASNVPNGVVEAEATQKRIPPKNKRHKHFCLIGKTHVAVH